MCKSGCHGCPALHRRTGRLAPHDNHSLAEGHRFGPTLASYLLLCCWSAHKSLAPRARTLLGVLGHATLNFVVVATLLFCFFCECPKFFDLAKQRRKMFLGVSEVGKIDFALYFCWLCVFFVIVYILLLRSRDTVLSDPKIYRHREYQLQGDLAEAMKKLLAEFIERGWIEPSDSEWASPAFIVPKKEKGEWRLVVDYRGLNEQTEHDSYSLPLIDTILQKQQKKRIFTVLDLKHGYHQMPLHPDSRPCTAMSTPLGPMKWKVVPMGAKNGNAAFERMMEDLLGPVRDCADPFVDDIIIGSGTENMTEDELIEAHEKDLRRVLSELDKHNMVCKPTKASLFVKEVEFAGHVVGHGQRRPMPGKLASRHHWEKPQTISELRSFMGFCNYYSGYVPMYAELSGPLHKMLQVGKEDGRKGSKKKPAWTPEAEDAFSRLKERLLGQLGLFLVDPDKGFVLRTDASDYAVGAVLERVRDDGSHVPVAFWSRILAEGQRRTWTAREKERYAIVCALRKWSGHIGLQPVVVCTDHQSLQSWHKEHVDTPSGPAARRA